MKVLLVHAHHEPQSFCSALFKQAIEQLQSDGHEVVISDLYAMDFNPVSDRRNFTTVKNPDYLKQQQEEMHASEADGFADDIRAEIEKLEKCDALIFSFPLWWFGLPAILKGWCDRVLAMGRVYGGGKLYESGIGGNQKRAMAILTTGGGSIGYDGWGLNPAIDTVLAPVQHGVFWFNGFRPLEPFVSWSPARKSPEERQEDLKILGNRIHRLFEEQTISMPLMADFPGGGHDSKQRFRVVIKRKKAVDERYIQLVPEEAKTIADLKRAGALLDFEMSASDDPEWRAFLKIRAKDNAEVLEILRRLPLADYLEFEITQLAPVVNPQPLAAVH